MLSYQEENYFQRTAVDAFMDWLQQQNRFGDLSIFSTSLLNDCLSQFYVDVSVETDMSQNRMKDLRYNLIEFISKCKNWTVEFTSAELQPSNVVFENLCQSYKESESESTKYKGSKKSPMILSDLKLLMSSNVISCDSPLGLLRKVWYDLTIHLGVCGQDALRSLQDDSFLRDIDEYGLHYFRLKPNQKSNGQRCRAEMQQWDWNGRMYELPGNPNCPVASLQLYLSKRSPHNSAFFQRPYTNNQWQIDQSPWFDAPLGHCILARIMSRMCSEAGLSKIYTNTAVRLTAADFLEERGIDVMQIMNLHPRSRPSNQNRTPMRTSREIFNASNTLHDIMYNV